MNNENVCPECAGLGCPFCDHIGTLAAYEKSQEARRQYERNEAKQGNWLGWEDIRKKMTTPIEDLVIGQKYLVRFDDCCVRGKFISTFLGWTLEGYYDKHKPIEEVEYKYRTAMFDHGINIDGWAWEAYQVYKK